MRLIDKSELKEWVENWFYQTKYYHPYSKSNSIPCSELYDILERMPTIDAVEVVRCKECKHGITQGITDGFVFCSKPYTERGNAMHRCDWFCADGERRDP